jgi:hypothetical protein
MAFKIKEGLIINTETVFNNTGVLQVNAPAWQNDLTLNLTGDATGGVTFNGDEGTVNLAVTIDGFDSGNGTISQNLVGDVLADDASTVVLENSAAGTGAYFRGDLRATDGTTTVLTVGDGVSTPQFEGNADTADIADALSSAVTVELTGDVAGSATFTNAGDTATISATVQPDSVALGTDTTGDYVESVGVAAGTGLSVTGTGEGAAVTISGVNATTTSKGVAQFSSSNFAVASGVVTIKDGGVANAELANDSVTIGSDAVALGTTITDINGLTSIDVDNITIDGNSILSSNTDGNIVLNPNGTGSVDVSNAKITSVAAPTQPQDAANKQYVDDTAQGLRTLPSAEVYVDSNLSATYDNGTNGVGATLTADSNGAFPTIDGYTLSQGDNIIVNGQTNKAHNGSYVLSTVGNGSNPWVLTRCSFCDEPDETAGSFEFVTHGTTYANTGWVLTASAEPVVIGTTELEWVQFSGAGTFSAGPGLDLTGTEFSVNVDDSTIEIVGDTLQVKDNGITNAKLANDHFTVATNGSGANFDIQLGDTWNFNEGEGIDITIGADTVTIDAELASTTNAGVASFAPSDFAVDGAGEVTISDVTLGTQTSGDYVATVGAGTGISVTGAGTEGRDATVELNHLGIENLVDPNADRILYWDDSSGNTEWLSVGTGLEISGTTLNNTQEAFSTVTVAGQSNVVADQVNDTLTVVAGDNISITTDSGSDSITINASSSTTGDDAFDNISQTVATTAPTVIDSFALATSRSAKYYIQISQDGDHQISEMMVIHNGTATFDTEFAVLETNGELCTLDTAVNGSDVELSVTMGSATSADIKIKRILVEV